MKNLSEFKTRKEWKEFIWFEFLNKLSKTKSTEQLREILESVLSFNERDFIIQRIIAAALIGQGKKYREIGEILWLSHNTISAIKKSLFKKSIYCGYRYYKSQNSKSKINVKKSKNKIIDDLGDATLDLLIWFASLPIPSGSGKGNWKLINPQYQDKLKYKLRRGLEGY